MKVVSTEALTKLIQLVKSAFVKVEDVVETQEVTLADVALSGDYGDLSNTPTIPTVNNATLTITQGGTTKGIFTANASSDVTIALDAGGGRNYVTTDTNQDITAIKTFVGDKRIKFKQLASGDRLGFTCYSNTREEMGGLELRPNTVNGKPIITLMTENLDKGYVGFRYWNGNRNILAPYPSSSGEYFITVGVTDGTNTVTTTDNGILNISSLLTPYALSSSLATVATSGSYNDLSDKPTIPTVNNPTITITQGGTTKGSFTLNQTTGDTIELDAGGGGGGSYTAGDGIIIQNDVISVDDEPIDEADTETVEEVTIAYLLSQITGYDATKTQSLKNVNGTLTWVTEV